MHGCPTCCSTSCPRENRQLAVSLADLMIKWEAHGRERVRLRRAANANANATSVPPATPAAGTKRPFEDGTDQPASATNGVAGVAAVAAASPATAGQQQQEQQQGREKVMKTATGTAPGAGAGAVVPARDGSSSAGGGGVAEGTTDSYRLSKSAVRKRRGQLWRIQSVILYTAVVVLASMAAEKGGWLCRVHC